MSQIAQDGIDFYVWGKKMKTIQFAAILVITLLMSSFAAMCQAQTDLSSTLKTGGTVYFSAKMENLSSRLQLSQEQKTKIKPIALQEVALFEQIHGNVALSPKEKLKKFTGIVNNADRQMKPILSAEQWQKLQDMRKEQRPELEAMAQAATRTTKK